MLIGVKETPKLARHIYSVDVDGMDAGPCVAAMIGTLGWVDHRLKEGKTCLIARKYGHVRAWVYGEHFMVELTPDIVTLEWDLDTEQLAKVEADIMRTRKGGAA